MKKILLISWFWDYQVKLYTSEETQEELKNALQIAKNGFWQHRSLFFVYIEKVFKKNPQMKQTNDAVNFSDTAVVV